MGKNLKGKECYQRKGRFVQRQICEWARQKTGKMFFSAVQEVRNQLEKAKYEDKHSNVMDETYAGSTIRQTFIAIGTMLKPAFMNDLNAKPPMNGVRYIKPTNRRTG